MPLRDTTSAKPPRGDDENTLVGAVGANDCHSRASPRLSPRKWGQARESNRRPGCPVILAKAGIRGHDGFGAYNDQFANNIL